MVVYMLAGHSGDQLFVLCLLRISFVCCMQGYSTASRMLITCNPLCFLKLTTFLLLNI